MRGISSATAVIFMAFLCSGAGCDDPPTRRDRDAAADSSIGLDASDASAIADAGDASVFEDIVFDTASPTDAMGVTDATDATHASDGAGDAASDAFSDAASDAASDAVSDASAADGG